ncbi:MAG TPA: TIGR02530 family flagellar biosynthesis protein [Bacteroidota bacterium]|nr:TIGR02530 family flagellar biosynthesis protein [Bacteroidota bacterium]
MSTTNINGVNLPFLPIGGVEGPVQKKPFELPGDRSFQKVLDSELNGLKFSKHAQDRLEQRQIQLNDTDKQQLENAVSLAQQKGSQDSLVFLRDMAFIVSVKNKTVVTAIDSANLKQNVFTNIDSAIVAS